ncbi:hypothetical protein TNCV_2633841 [Trichonephila clavipes]|nr:hypothetical protein TNCV_2633841 [Trichonephila clavipes]
MMKNGCTATIQAVKVGGQHPGNQQVRLQDERQLTRSYFSVSGGIVEELSIEVPKKVGRLSTVQYKAICESKLAMPFVKNGKKSSERRWCFISSS